MADKLLQCPFCGGEVELVKQKSDKFEFVLVSCKNCDATIGIGGSNNEQKVIEAWNKRTNPWHTGTPTEAGLYVIAFRFGNKIEHEIREMFYSPDYGMTFGIKKDIVAYQKIEPYRG